MTPFRQPAPGSVSAEPRQQEQPSSLETAVRVAQRVLSSHGDVAVADLTNLNRAYGSSREARWILLRALGAEPVEQRPAAGPRCPAAHPDDPDPCRGPAVVMVLDRANAGAEGCEHHGARLLASLDGGRVYALEDAPPGAAIRVFKAAATLPPYAWTANTPDTQPSQPRCADDRRRGEGQ
ncbi:hypothetical protein [Streptomyces sp. NPDC088736]|uniref:hypothetical protein n=1 Tax=Streptomyces sp. NPDC088736 TaxID=3365881 RepID=UPI003808075E